MIESVVRSRQGKINFYISIWIEIYIISDHPRKIIDNLARCEPSYNQAETHVPVLQYNSLYDFKSYSKTIFNAASETFEKSICTVRRLWCVVDRASSAFTVWR
jgi:hypothetical protein